MLNRNRCASKVLEVSVVEIRPQNLVSLSQNMDPDYPNNVNWGSNLEVLESLFFFNPFCDIFFNIEWNTDTVTPILQMSKLRMQQTYMMWPISYCWGNLRFAAGTFPTFPNKVEKRGKPRGVEVKTNKTISQRSSYSLWAVFTSLQIDFWSLWFWAIKHCN